MNKTELARALAHRMHLGGDAEATRTAALILSHLFAGDGIIAGELVAGRPVHVTGFGTFDTTHVASRFVTPPHRPDGVIRNAIEVPAHRRPVFRAGAGLKARVTG